MWLDEDQKRAVETPGSALVVAGPGAGKTRVLLARALHLLEASLPPERILLLTFTVRTRAELTERLSGLSAPVRAETFHALAYDLLSEALGHPPRLLSEEESLEIAGRLARSHGLRLSPRKVLEGLRAGRPEFEPLREEYLGYLSRNDLYDYLRILLEVPKRLSGRSFQGYALLIDEYQDLSPELLRFLTTFSRAEFFLVGDPAQAIYGFRGARPETVHAFLREFLPDLRVHYLRRSYRVPEEILRLAEGLREDPFGEGIRLSAERSGGKVRLLSFPSERAEAIGVAKEVAQLLGGAFMESSRGRGLPPGEVLVLARLRALLEPLKETLAREGLPVAEPEKEAEEARKRLSETAQRLLSRTQRPEEALFEVERLLPGARAWLSGLSAEELSARLLLLSTRDLLSPSRQGVNLLTIHGAKGLEAEAVVLAGAEEGILPLTVLPESDPEEERRLLYVALTRAKGSFLATFSRRRFLYGRRLSGRPTPWLSGLSREEKAPPRRRPRQVGLFALLFLFLLAVSAARAEPLADLLSRYSRLMVASHPGLAALASRVRAQKKRVAPAGALPDPRVVLSVRNAGDPIPANTLGEEPMSTAGVRVEQPLPWPGKRHLRARMAELEARRLAARYRRALWQNWRGLAEGLLDLAYLEEEARTLQEMKVLLREIEESVRLRYETGHGAQAEIFRAANQRSFLEERLRLNAEKQALKVAALEKRFLFRKIPEPLVELPRELPGLPPEKTLLSALERTPEVEDFRLQLREKELGARLAELEKRPDFRVFFGWHSRGTLPEIYEFGLGFGVPLFLGRKQGPLAEAAREEVLAAGQSLEDVRGELAFRLRDLLLAARTERDLWALYAREILPRAELELASARDHYASGRGTLESVLSAFRRVLEARLSLFRHRTSYLKALAGLESLLARPLFPDLPGPEGGIP
ncbi:UvrD-helicase domain-containing protein [Thermosulfurimonas marina]|nr:UvrD-helicase domain-containing protein [Thermosulfurimonas marina]